MMRPRARERNVPPMSAQVEEPQETPKKHRPWAWIAVSVVLVLVAGGLLVWALSLSGDLDDQKAQTEKAQQSAQTAQQDAEAANDEVDKLSQQVDDLGQ